jgi:hypothetical protein
MNVLAQLLVVHVQIVNVNDVVKTNDVVQTRRNVRVLYVDVLTEEKNVHVLLQDVHVKTVSASDVVKINNHNGYERAME